MFIPGYTLSLVIYPKNDELEFFSRIALSFAFSVASVIIVVLFIDEFIAMRTTPENIVISLVVFTLILLIIWRLELKIQGINLTHQPYELFRRAEEKILSLKNRNSKKKHEQPIPNNLNEKTGCKSDKTEFPDMYTRNTNINKTYREYRNRGEKENPAYSYQQGDNDENLYS